LVWQSKLDELSDAKNPSQLIGSNAYIKANISLFKFNNPCLAILSTDGLHRFTSIDERLKLISYIDNNIPTEDNLNYICQTLIANAISNGSRDDISIVLIWLSPNED
jgi:serine/threonine protein phosphatase PrpC